MAQTLATEKYEYFSHSGVITDEQTRLLARLEDRTITEAQSYTLYEQGNFRGSRPGTTGMDAGKQP